MKILILLFILIFSPHLNAEDKVPIYSLTFERLDALKSELPLEHFNVIKKEIIKLYQPWASEDGITGNFAFKSLELKYINEDNIQDVILTYQKPGHQYPTVNIYIARKIFPFDLLELIRVTGSSSYPDFLDTRTHGFLDFKVVYLQEDYICKFYPNEINYMCYQITNYREDNLKECIDSEIDLTYYDNSC